MVCMILGTRDWRRKITEGVFDLKKVRLGGVLALLALVLLAGGACAEERRFDGTMYDLKGDLWVLEEMTGNINGDEYEDTVRLVALRADGDRRVDRMWIEVQHGYAHYTPRDRQPAPYLVPLPEAVKGYNPHAELAKFVEGDTEQLFLTFDATVNGPRYFAVVRIRANDVRRDAAFLFDSRTMDSAIVSGNYLGRYLANIRIADTNTNVTLDVSSRKAFYEKQGVYGAKGEIKRTVAVGVTRYEKISIGPKGVDGVSMLVAQMGVYGWDDSDRLATVECTLKYDRLFDSWKVADAQVIPEPDIKVVQPK